MDRVFGEVGGVAGEHLGFVVQRAVEDPAHVRPPGAVARGVRVAGLVGVLVVHAVDGDPVERPALQRHGAAAGHEVLQPLGGRVAAMGELPVVAHADADILADQPYGEKDHDRGPAPVKGGLHDCRQGEQMKECDRDEEDPVELLRPLLGVGRRTRRFQRALPDFQIPGLP